MIPCLSRIRSYCSSIALHRAKVIIGKEIPVLDRPVLGDTAIHTAVKVNSFEICELLLKAGVNPNISDLDGFTPLDTAQMRRYDDIAQLLKKYGALPSNRQ
jgi:hypothetical protein